jgi:hypothetical protein
MADVPDKVLADKLRAKDEELRQRERLVKQREQGARDRHDELEAAKASCDALMVELHQREATLAEVEKRHGTLKRREDEVASRENTLADKEAALQRRLQQLSHDEQALTQSRIAQKAVAAAAAQRFTLAEAQISTREREVSATEAQLAAYRLSAEKRMQEEEEALRKRERFASETEKRLRDASRTNEKRALEAEHLNEQAAERLKVIKASQLELETKTREVRWKDDAMTDLLKEANERKASFTHWEAKLCAREATVAFVDSEHQARVSALDLREAELGLLREQVLQADRSVSEREENVRSAAVRIDSRNADLAARESQVAGREAAVTAAGDAIVEREAALSLMSEEQRVRGRALRTAAHNVEEKERALKSWLLELEYRHRAIEQRECRPRAYTAPALKPDADPPVLQLGAEDSSAGRRSAGFDRGLVTMQLALLQRAYLGATVAHDKRTASERVHAASLSDTSTGKKTTTRPGSRVASCRRSEAQCAALTLDSCSERHSCRAITVSMPSADEVDEAETARRELVITEQRFRDLSAGFAVMDGIHRAELFSPTEIDEVVSIIEEDCRSFDEHHFLTSLTAVAMPRVSVTAAPQDSIFVATVQRWVVDRSAVVDERLRRSTARRLQLLARGISLLEGRVLPHDERVRALVATAPRRTGRSQRMPAVVVSTREQSASPTALRAKRPDYGDCISWNAENSTPSPGRPPGSAGDTPWLMARLIDTLPETLRAYYAGK